MNIKLKKFTLSAITAAVVLTGQGSAYAIIPVTDVASIAVNSTGFSGVVTAVGAGATAITAGIAAQTTSMLTWGRMDLLPALTGLGSLIGQMSIESGKMQSVAAAEQSGMDASLKIEQRFSETDADPCAVSANAYSANAASDAMALAAAAGRGGNSGPRDSGGPLSANQAARQLNRILDIAEGKTAPPSPDILAGAAAKAACSNFVGSGSASKLRAENCINAGFTVGNPSGFDSADTSATTLFDGPQKTGEAARKRFSVNYTKNSPEDIAVHAFMRNIGSALELRGLKAAELSTAAGQRFTAVKDTYDARLSLAQRPLVRHIAMTAQSTTNIKTAEYMAADDEFVTAYLSRNVPDWKTKGVSVDELSNLDVVRKHNNIKWIAKTETKGLEWIAGEQLRMTAQTNALLWSLNQEIRENSVLLGGMTASTLRAELLPELKAAHTAAAR